MTADTQPGLVQRSTGKRRACLNQTAKLLSVVHMYVKVPMHQRACVQNRYCCTYSVRQKLVSFACYYCCCKPTTAVVALYDDTSVTCWLPSHRR